MNNKKTALYNEHIEHAAKMTEYAGWLLPISYDSIKEEHMIVRKYCGVFDVSHMGEIRITGENAEVFINQLVTNNIAKMNTKDIKYSPMCNEEGMVIDDILIYKYSNEDYVVVVNASNIEKDLAWFNKQGKKYKVEIQNISEKISQIAVQGPAAEAVLQKLTYCNLKNMQFYKFESGIYIAEKKCTISRTGYTGEDGFEIYCKNEDIRAIWHEILLTGKDKRLKGCGLGARDTLRFEAGLPLYGNEMSEEINPLEAGLNHFIDFRKEDFIGKEKLMQIKKDGIKRKLVKVEMQNKKIPRHGYEVLSLDEKLIGYITTGYYLESQERSLGIALIETSYTKNELLVKIRKENIKAEILKEPFYIKKYKE